MTISLEFRQASYVWEHRGGKTVGLAETSLIVAGHKPVYLCGAAGSGKSTLAMLAAGLLEPSSGSIHWQLEGPRKQRCGFAFQFPEEFFFEDTVEREAKQLAPDCAAEEIAEIYRQLGLNYDKLAPRAPFRLSAAEGRLAAIGNLLAGKPEILILDEPTLGLDRAHKERLLSTLCRWRNNDRFLMIVTHDVSLLRTLPGVVLVLKDGSTRWQGKSKEILQSADLMKEFGLA